MEYFTPSYITMINKPKQATKTGISKYIKNITIVATTLFITLTAEANPANDKVQKEIAEIFKKNPDKEIVVKVENNQSVEKTAKFEAVNDTINALDFAVQNVDKYYPDMKDHVDSLINSFRDQEHKDTVNFLFQEHIFKNISDPKKQVASILYCIESFVFDGDSKVNKLFSKTYKIGTIIDKEEYKYLFDFNKKYNKRFKGYYMKLEQILIDMNKTIEENNKTIEENNKIAEEQKKQIEGIINNFTINDIKTNPTIKKLILDTEILYIKYKYIIPIHLAELIQAAKQ